jgi:uncharacterized protein YlxW (UPF0749 family)
MRQRSSVPGSPEAGPVEEGAADGSSVWKVAAIALGMIAAGACAYSFILFSAFSTELAAARIDSKLAHNDVMNLRAELSSTEAQANALQEKLQSAQARLAARSRRPLPIRLSFHDAVLHSEKVAVLHNLAGADLEVVLEVRSPASGEQVRRSLVINAHGLLRIGAAQGLRFAPGQIVTLENDQYRPVVRIVS